MHPRRTSRLLDRWRTIYILLAMNNIGPTRNDKSGSMFRGIVDPGKVCSLILHLCMHMYVLTMQLLLLLFQFLSVSSREHPMDLITFNSMRQLPRNTLDPDDQAAPAASHPSETSWKFLRGPLDLSVSMGSPTRRYSSEKPQPHWDFRIFLPLVTGTSNYLRLFKGSLPSSPAALF